MHWGKVLVSGRHFARRVGLLFLPLSCSVGLMAIFEGSTGVAALYEGLIKGHLIYMIAIVANLGIGLLLATLQHDKGAEKYELEGYWATLVVTATLLPGVTALITLVIYLANFKHALFWGSAIAVWAWFVTAFACHWLAEAEYAIPSSYGELNQRLTSLKDELEQMSPNSQKKTEAFKEAEKQKSEIEKELKHSGLSWALASGYDNVWDRLYRAEEALIEIMPEDRVVAEAVYDDLRLQDSKIDHRDYLCAKLRQAVSAIDPSAVNYLIPSAKTIMPLTIVTPSMLPENVIPALYKHTLVAIGGTPPYTWTVAEDLPDWLKLDPNTGMLIGTPKKPTEDKPLSFTIRVTDSASQMTEKSFALTIHSTPKTPVPPVMETESKAIARGVLRTVRRSINEYRGQCWDGLIVARNRLLATIFFTTLMAYALLMVALLYKADPHTIFAASAFYLVGGTVGLLNRLRRESQIEAAVRDYGLSAARLITVSLLSGLTAICGVVLIAMMPYTDMIFSAPKSEPQAITHAGKSLQPTMSNDATKLSKDESTPPAQQGQSMKATGNVLPKESSDKHPPCLSRIFNLCDNVIGFLVAAIFGLTPGLLFRRLEQLSERYKSDLKSSEATQGAQKT